MPISSTAQVSLRFKYTTKLNTILISLFIHKKGKDLLK